jgi:hypothetical protein
MITENTRNLLHAATDGIMCGIARIMRAKDSAAIEAAITAIEKLSLEMAENTATEPGDVRRLIYDGVGIFKDIQAKCLRFNTLS